MSVKQESVTDAGISGFSWLVSSPAFLRLWLAQIFSQTALNAATYGLIVLVAKQSGSVTATAVTIVAFALPVVLWSLPAGVLIDRLDRRQILWVSNFLRAVTSLLCVIVLLIDHTALLPLYVLAFSMASVGAFFAPAEGATIPSLVPPRHLMAALGLFNMTFILAQALGLIFLGPLTLHWMPTLSLGLPGQRLLVLPIESLFLMITLLFLLAAGLTLSLPKQRRTLQEQAEEIIRKAGYPSTRSRAIWWAFAESWACARQNRPLGAAMWQLTLGGVITAVITLLAPSFVVQFLRQPPELAGLLFLPAGVGFVLGSLLVPRLAQRFTYAPTVIGGLIALAGALVLLTLVFLIGGQAPQESWWQSGLYDGVILALTFLMGFALDCVTLPAQARMQEYAPDRLRGRILSLQQWWLNLLMVPGVLLVGELVDHLGLVLPLEMVAAFIVSAGLSSVYYGRPARWSSAEDRLARSDARLASIGPEHQGKIPLA